ncbi:MAG: hypothetical protein ACI35R_06620, partial [Bacillus sp. (in: firmicutes)]
EVGVLVPVKRDKCSTQKGNGIGIALLNEGIAYLEGVDRGFYKWGKANKTSELHFIAQKALKWFLNSTGIC